MPRSAPGKDAPRATSTRTAPATKRPHEGTTPRGSSRPLAATTTGPGSSATAPGSRPVDGCRARDDAPAIDRHRQAEALVVVGVVAHQIHPTGAGSADRRIGEGGAGRSLELHEGLTPGRYVGTGDAARAPPVIHATCSERRAAVPHVGAMVGRCGDAGARDGRASRVPSVTSATAGTAPGSSPVRAPTSCPPTRGSSAAPSWSRRTGRRPDGSTARRDVVLSVVRVRPATAEAAAPPLLYLSGGPGDASLRYIANRLDDPIVEDREVVYLDLRGIGESVPSLACPEVDALGVFAAPLDDAAARLEYRDALASVPEPSRRPGHRPAVPTTTRRPRPTWPSVHVPRWASTRGTSTASATAVAWRSDSCAATPRASTALVLDASLPPQGNFFTELWPNADRSFSAPVRRCAARPERVARRMHRTSRDRFLRARRAATTMSRSIVHWQPTPTTGEPEHRRLRRPGTTLDIVREGFPRRRGLLPASSRRLIDTLTKGRGLRGGRRARSWRTRDTFVLQRRAEPVGATATRRVAYERQRREFQSARRRKLPGHAPTSSSTRHVPRRLPRSGTSAVPIRPDRRSPCAARSPRWCSWGSSTPCTRAARATPSPSSSRTARWSSSRPSATAPSSPTSAHARLLRAFVKEPAGTVDTSCVAAMSAPGFV